MEQMTRWRFDKDGKVSKTVIEVIGVNNADKLMMQYDYGSKRKNTMKVYLDEEKVGKAISGGTGYFVYQREGESDFQSAKEAVLQVIERRLSESFDATERLIDKFEAINKCEEPT